MLRKYLFCAFGAITCVTALAGAVLGQDARDPYLDVPAYDVSGLDARGGYWASHTEGSPVKVGEYQDLRPSAFYDVDMLRSNGDRTLNFSATGTDRESNDLNLNYFGPAMEANVNYQGFVHNLGHDNLGQFTDSGGTNNNTDNGATGAAVRGQQILRQDVNAGEDYAIRVQELRTSFKGQLTPDLKIRLDVWGMYKEGERQVNSMQECYPHTYTTTDPAAPPPATISSTRCHVLSQSQHIDWQTTEVKPIVEWNLGPVVFEYSRPMRVFNQYDQTVYRFYDIEGASGYNPYSIVPDNYTQIDQFKVSARVNEDNRFYGFLYTGNTRSEGEGILATNPNGPPVNQVNNRRMGGADIRWTNTAIDNLTITPYLRYTKETNEFSEPTGAQAGGVWDVTFPIDFERTQAGVRTLWRPFGGGFGLGGLAINANYEYGDLHRSNLVFPTDNINAVLEEQHTISNTFTIGPTVRWSPQFDTYLHYKYYDTSDPLFGVAYHTPATGIHGDAFPYFAETMNTALPEHDDIVEIGGTWMPGDRFMLNGWVGIDVQSQSVGQLTVANTNGSLTPTPPYRMLPLSSKSEDYPCGINGTFRAGEQWTFNFGLAYYTNWIDQDMTFGPGSDHGFGSPPASTEYGALVNRIAYGGRAGVLNLGVTYNYSPRLRFLGQAEYVHGIDSAYQLSGDPNFPATNSTTAAIPGLFRDDVMITRVSAGIDYLVSRHCTAYFRYVLFDYQDSADKAQIAASTQPVDGLPLSGTSNLFLGGFNATF